MSAWLLTCFLNHYTISLSPESVLLAMSPTTVLRYGHTQSASARFVRSISQVIFKSIAVSDTTTFSVYIFNKLHKIEDLLSVVFSAL